MSRFVPLLITLFLALIPALILALTVFSYGQNRYANVKIKTVKIGNGIYMLQGAGGNIGSHVAGPRGAVLTAATKQNPEGPEQKMGSRIFIS